MLQSAMKPFPHFLKLLPILVLVLFSTGCVGRFGPAYGYASPGDALPDNAPVLLPANAPSIAQGYLPDEGHEGIDIMAAKGTPVIAAAPGIVLESRHEWLYGNRIIISHGVDKNGSEVRTRYLHLLQRHVETGDQVVRGQPIGSLGSTGLLASYPHLHFEVRLAEQPGQDKSHTTNPHLYWADGPGHITCFDPGVQVPAPELITYPLHCSSAIEGE